MNYQFKMSRAKGKPSVDVERTSKKPTSHPIDELISDLAGITAFQEDSR
jgi:hypothetical protein